LRHTAAGTAPALPASRCVAPRRARGSATACNARTRRSAGGAGEGVRRWTSSPHCRRRQAQCRVAAFSAVTLRPIMLWHSLYRVLDQLRPRRQGVVMLADAFLILLAWHFTYLFRMGMDRWLHERPSYDWA